MTDQQRKAHGIDSDYAWLMTHLEIAGAISSREYLVQKIVTDLTDRVENGRLPYTLGVFGGWGTGKTTLLAMLASGLEGTKHCKVVYFNSWKYAGFMEIVPALIYKILLYGVHGEAWEREEAAKRVILALGSKYADQVGEWAKNKIDVNPVELFKDVYAAARETPKVLESYYTQVDKAQDELRKSLGSVSAKVNRRHSVVVLIDELDRCDPDEAFTVIKQMRVLFGMRDLPVAFVICANAEPIGLAIKHRYGLESDTGDYEARRILEKFVDSYEDLSGAEYLGPLIRKLWESETLPWIMTFDEANANPRFELETVRNATAFDAMTTAIPLFANIRLLHKSLYYVRSHRGLHKHLLWTNWFLEIAKQLDPRLRAEIKRLTQTIERICRSSYESLPQIRYHVKRDGPRPQILFETDKGNTLFAIFRSLFWEHASKELLDLQESKDPERVDRARALGAMLSEPLRVDAVVLMSLLPFKKAPTFDGLCERDSADLPDLREELRPLIFQFGNELSRNAL